LENNSNNRWNQSSPRQLWLAKKKAEQRKVAQQSEEEARRKQEEEELMKKKCIAREKIRTWFQGKKLVMMKQKELAEIAQTEMKIEAANRQMQQLKAQEKYREWLQVKQHAKIVEIQRREIEHRSRELADREKRKRAEESFQSWLRSNKTTLARRQTPYTKCISGGVVISRFILFSFCFSYL
uniref:CCDC34 domain-containing protein n=1 Tax=Rodentolepis nana TaxID=102285 RepID=A0A0R3TRE5_RODNA